MWPTEQNYYYHGLIIVTFITEQIENVSDIFTQYIKLYTETHINNRKHAMRPVNHKALACLMFSSHNIMGKTKSMREQSSAWVNSWYRHQVT